MRKVQVTETLQPGIPTLLEDAERANQARLFERSTAHLPGTMAKGIACYRALLERHHAAMLAGDAQAAKRMQQETVLLALKLNGGQRGYLAGEDAPGCVLQRVTAAEAGRAEAGSSWAMVRSPTFSLNRPISAGRGHDPAAGFDGIWQKARMGLGRAGGKVLRPEAGSAPSLPG